MKKFFTLAAVAMMAFAPFAQAQVKVDAAGLRTRIAKSDADIANAKRNTRAATWLDRGDLFVEAFNAPAAGAYVGMDLRSAELMFGTPASQGEQLFGEASYARYSFSTIDAFFIKDEAGTDRMAFYLPTLVIAEDALAKAIEAYQRAYELDGGSASKVRAGLKAVGDAYKTAAGNDFSQQQYAAAAMAFAMAYDVQLAAPSNVVDTMACFNAGFLYTVDQKFDLGRDFLEKALAYGYENNGDTYFYLYHCYFGLKDEAKAKEVLMTGLQKYPHSTQIIEGLLAIYTQGDNDPNDIIPLVEKAIAEDPTNPALYSGLGLVYDKLSQPDKAIEAFARSAELTPNDFGANFNLGLLCIKRGDKLNEEFNATSSSLSTEQYDAGLAAVNAAYSAAITPLEKALNLKAGDPATIELLKNLSFRLRDEAGMMDKYNHYNELFKALPAAQ